MKFSLGLIETKGLTGAIEAADVMVKTADVKLIGKENISDGIVVIKIIGEDAQVKAAIEAGILATQKVGQLISAHVISQLDDQLKNLIYSDSFSADKKNWKNISLSEESNTTEDISIGQNKELQNPTLFDQQPDLHAEKKVQLKKVKKADAFKSDAAKVDSTSRLETLRKEAIKELSSEESLVNKTEETKSQHVEVPSFEELSKLNVHKLRHLARSFYNFPIKGRKISRANREELISYFEQIR